MSKRWFSFIPTAALALVVLAACGGEQAAEEDATRVPDAANAPAAEATEPAEAAEATLVPATPAADAGATPMGAQTVAGGAATPVAGAMATPMDAGVAATPVTFAPTSVATPDVAGATPASDVVGADPAAQELTVTSFDIYFEPTELTIPAGQDVVVALPNEGAAPHNFSIDELGISVDQPAGATDLSTTINAAAGEYEYYCNVPGHKQAGMVGTLTVE